MLSGYSLRWLSSGLLVFDVLFLVCLEQCKMLPMMLLRP